ncbi:twitching motility protein PilT [Cyclobacterium xiamenense]|uniref:twitching motility protein PilT n=1 Tax=Cyclobacterium xiamenense TaxID=1297121 RepID=UPI0019D6742D|nr:twitching motility protein PilT [Cyclobacterium xiamenense]
MIQIAGPTRNEIIQALKNNFKDFEDSIQYSTALSIEGIEAILTRNVKDYLNSEIAVFSPENYLKSRAI